MEFIKPAEISIKIITSCRLEVADGIKIELT